MPTLIAPKEQEAKSSANLNELRATADPLAPFPMQLAWLKRCRQLVAHERGLRPVRIALLGNGTLNLLSEVLRLWLWLEGFDPEIYLCAYNSFQQELLDLESPLHAFRPDVVWLLTMERDVRFEGVLAGVPQQACEAAVCCQLQEIQQQWITLRNRRPGVIVQNLLANPVLQPFGHFEATVPWSRRSLIRKLNDALSASAQSHQVVLLDVGYVAQSFSLDRWCDDRQWYQSKQPIAPNAFGLLAFHFSRLVGSTRGTARKCIVLDLDNTLWGGVIGDDGMAGLALGDGPEGEAFVAFQHYLKELKDRGILLAVCSKNEEAIAQEPFHAHPNMLLRLDDIACFRANWGNKADNLRAIAEKLNLGLDALVFVDDNPSERALVRAELPQIAVVELPVHPSGYVAALARGCYFETVSFSQEDLARGRQYQENARRDLALSGAADLESFLRDLQMEANSGVVDAFHLPRTEQLISKTNQFHFTGTRYSAAELAAFAVQPGNWLRWFSLKDKFGDHGLISAVLLVPEGKDMAIDTWVMSCRVFSRGMEDFVFLEMCRSARTMGAAHLIGRYKPTPKNTPIATLFKKLGFTFVAEEGEASRWIFDLTAEPARPQLFIRSAAE